MLTTQFLISDENPKTRLEKGFTNQIYLCTIDGVECALRIPAKDWALITSHEGEIAAMRSEMIQKYDVPTLFYDPHTGVKLTRYIHDALTYSESTRSDKIQLSAQCMKSLHQEKLNCDYHFDVLKMFEAYRTQAEGIPFTFAQLDEILSYIDSQQDLKVFCHNDWVDGNLLFTDERMYLIDYEYAGMNHPYFDVMSFLSENEIDDPHQRKQFYDIYFDGDVPYNQLKAWELFEDALWCHWAWGMYVRRRDQLYYEIAQAKARHYQKVQTAS